MRAAPSNSWSAILRPILVVQTDNLVRPRIWNVEDEYRERVSLVKVPTALFERGRTQHASSTDDEREEYGLCHGGNHSCELGEEISS